VNDLFPKLSCETTIDSKITYRGNEYYNFYKYNEVDTEDFDECYELLSEVQLLFLIMNSNLD
jgi:hypothetical protein